MCALPSGVEFRADLHCHSTKSDGALTPTELVDLAKKQNLQALSITDHDTVEAYEEAIPYAKSQGIKLGVGVELSCHFKKASVHVLAYGVSLTSTDLQSYLKRLQNRRVKRNREILAKLARLGMIIQEKELLEKHPSHSAIGRPHIAAAMLEKGYVISVEDAFRRYIGDKGCCFVSGERFPVEEALKVVHKAGGKAFLAHPHLHRNKGLVKEVLSLGLDGIECYYARFPLEFIKPWLVLAEERGLLISGGSDFHYPSEERAMLGSSYVSLELFEKIFTLGHA